MKFKIAAAALIICASFAQADTCMPNLIKEDMCKVASNLAIEGKNSIPIKISENMQITDIKSENVRLILTASLSYDLSYLEETYQHDDKKLKQAKDYGREYAKNNACNKKPTRSFINLGGQIEYDYVFNDGSIYDVVTITSCE
ncbi:hypothetical protein SJ322_24890 [Serratia marcescens]|uniref:hypothetical protein n=1 Tax=Serratia marcescens TaxID=615 RepID=UPI0029DC7AED|nr:hypothetical protein [Serratia marcescens]MDX7275482.1 hypothetical protein [Serratia marcescens]